ncbi:hypothetical protein [Diaphorobacter caeni]|uniref:hypothetical protein n=1 Tax=Diaphorobacter caeni TaxID=2784387 RepID=UPI00188F02D1|nr:hypothetical protein [Diaphorobacter caeni]MBF5007627.1 hypothetical protein [Diaphorobacter caeni]
MSYSTNPVLDQMKYQDACDEAEDELEARVQSLYNDTMDAVKRGDLSRIVETFGLDEKNGYIAVSGLNCGRAHGSPYQTKALETLARAWAQHHAKP